MTDETIRHEITRLWGRVDAIERERLRDNRGEDMARLMTEAQRYADTGDMRVKGELVALVNSVQRTLDQIKDLVGTEEPAPKSWRNDWRLLVGVGAVAGLGLGRAPDALPGVIKLIGGVG